MSLSYFKVFNQIIDEFFKELIEIFPDESKIKVQYNLFQTVCKANFKTPCNEFMFGSIPFLEKICMKDESFFKGDNGCSFLNSLNFQNIWTDTLSPVTKDAIWRYIKSFFTIGLNCIQMPPDTLPLIKYIINN